MKKRELPTGKYEGVPQERWNAVVQSAKQRPHLRQLARNYEATGDPACLVAIMDKADADLWSVYYTGRSNQPL